VALVLGRQTLSLPIDLNALATDQNQHQAALNVGAADFPNLLLCLRYRQAVLLNSYFVDLGLDDVLATSLPV
jgi:hypothetical protein